MSALAASLVPAHAGLVPTTAPRGARQWHREAPPGAPRMPPSQPCSRAGPARRLPNRQLPGGPAMSDRVSQADRGPWPGISWGPEPFFSHYWPRLLHFLTPLIQSSDYRLAEDAAQVAFERACDNWDMLQFRCARPIHGCSRWPSASCAARRLRTALAAACMKTSTAPPPRPICEPLPRPTTGWRTTCLLLRGTSPASPRGRGHRPRSPRLHPAGDGRNPRGVANGTVRCQLSLAAAKLRVLLSEAESAPRRNTV